MIQPHIHDTSFIPYSFNAFSPFGTFDPYSQLSNVLNSKEYQPRKALSTGDNAGRADSGNGAIIPSNTPSFAVAGGSPGSTTNNSPIPVNEFGLPPSLVPLSYTGGINENPISLAPYNFNSYPLIYDQFNGYAPSGYLPHFGYYPPAIYGYPNHRKPSLISPGQGGSEGVAVANRNGLESGVSASTNGDGIPGTGFGVSGEGADNQVSYSRDDDTADAASAATGGVGAESDVSGDDRQGTDAVGGSGRSDARGISRSGEGGTTSSQSSSSVGSSSSRTFNRTGRTFTIRDERIKNFPNKIKEIQDVPPPPLPYGAHSSDEE